MPGVGVTDAEQIFRLVASQRSLVAASVIIQLISAVLYVPALLGTASEAIFTVSVNCDPPAQALLGTASEAITGQIPGVKWSAGLLLVGATGSAADAVLHLLAYAMTAPGLDLATLIRVMAFMQGPACFCSRR
ncbi:MAG TPA: hypothetical protein VNQ79_20515 [Blastocatellia bacterium]|nr:hypothetical protein [Blastocatellia bacterium]